MSVRRGASAPQPLVGRRSARLDEVLRAGQAHAIATIGVNLTRREGESYQEFVERQERAEEEETDNNFPQQAPQYVDSGSTSPSSTRRRASRQGWADWHQARRRGAADQEEDPPWLQQAQEDMNRARNQLQNLNGFQNTINKLEEDLEACEAKFEALRAERRLTDSNLSEAIRVASDPGYQWVHPVYGPISKWDVSDVTSMESAFRGQQRLKGVDLSEWDVSRVRSMKQMFAYSKGFNSNLSKWNVSNVENMFAMFQNAQGFEGNGISTWNTNQVSEMKVMFQGCADFNANLQEWKFNKNMDSTEGMFRNCTSFKGGGLFKWNVSNIKNMRAMFQGCTAFNADLSGWKVSKVNDMTYMFQNTPALKIKPVWFTRKS